MKKQNTNSTSYDCLCKYCGNPILNVDNNEFKTQNEANEYATLHCGCEESLRYQNSTKSIQNLENFIDNLESEFADNLVQFDTRTKKMLKEIGLFVLNDSTTGVTCSIKLDTAKIKFSTNSDGRLIIDISYTEKNKKLI